MTTTTMTSLVTRRFEDERRLLGVAASSSSTVARLDFLPHGDVAAVRAALAAADVDGALRFLSR